MKRDMGLIRQVLQRIEESPAPYGDIDFSFPDRTEEEVSYQVMLLAKNGLVEAIDCSDSESPCCWQPTTLTMQGHDFLDAIRHDTVWNKVKEAAKEKGGAIPLEVLKALAVKLAMGVFGV